MKINKKRMFWLIAVSTITLALSFALPSCKEDEDDADVRPTLSDAKSITAFSFPAVDNSELSSDVTADVSGTSITPVVPNGTGVTALVASFTTTGDSVSVDGITQTSGITANDFTSAVTYTVTAADSSTQDYTVAVSINAPTGSSCILNSSNIDDCILE